MATVLVDARIESHTGMGRYMRCTAAALARYADSGVRIEVLRRTGTPRYTDVEDGELLAAARCCHADLLHMLDYRVPLDDPGLPVIATVHDVMRILHPEHCDTDEQFQARFGPDVFDQLNSRTDRLRRLTELPPGALRSPRSVYEEHYQRMLVYSCARSRRIITPTWTVADQLTATVGTQVPVAVFPWGIDHAAAEEPTHPTRPAQPPRREPGAFLLYVGQARPHKGIPSLIEAYRASNAPVRGIRLVCVGRDFDPGKVGARLVTDELGANAINAGSIDDQALNELYARAEALLLPTEHEGFGFPPLEALAAGCPVIAADIPVLHETLGAHARFVDHADPSALAAEIDHAIETGDGGPTARAGRAAWAAHYTWQRHAESLLALYRCVLEAS